MQVIQDDVQTVLKKNQKGEDTLAHLAEYFEMMQ